MTAHQKLQQRAEELAEQGAEPFRIELIRRARRFKRSWIDMAEALSELRARRTYEAWGFANLYAYCSEELLLTRATVDKLTGSYQAVERYAPELLKGGDDARVPPYESVSYFARALGSMDEGDEGRRGAGSRPPPPPEVVDQLRAAVFDEARPLASIRREFHDSLFAGNERSNELRRVQGARAQIRRLLDALPEIEGLRADRVDEATRILCLLDGDLAELDEAQPRKRKTG